MDFVFLRESLNKDFFQKSRVVTGKDKDDYALDERVVFNQDFSTNGIDIKKGDTGIIDNRLLSSGGRIYVVILDKTKDTVKVSGVYFE